MTLRFQRLLKYFRAERRYGFLGSSRVHRRPQIGAESTSFIMVPCPRDEDCPDLRLTEM
jgi:hypothetical protein